MNQRDYESIAARVRGAIGAPVGGAGSAETAVKAGFSVPAAASAPGAVSAATLRFVVDALWESLAETGVSWAGFYLFHPGEPEDRAMTLGPSRDTPACSPIGLHGACGQALTARRTLIVGDVRDLGEGYVACDPRDASEIVLPCAGGVPGADDGGCWGVLDLDSHEVGSFDERDEAGLTLVLAAAGIRVPGGPD